MLFTVGKVEAEYVIILSVDNQLYFLRVSFLLTGVVVFLLVFKPFLGFFSALVFLLVTHWRL